MKLVQGGRADQNPPAMFADSLVIDENPVSLPPGRLASFPGPQLLTMVE